MFDYIALVYIYSTDIFHGTLRNIFSKFYVLCCHDFVQKEAHMNADISWRNIFHFGLLFCCF